MKYTNFRSTLSLLQQRINIWNMSQLISRTSKRFISISQTSVISATPSLVSGSSSEEVGARVDTLPVTVPHDAQFQVLGTPPSILSVSLSPSVPLYIRKGSLLSLYGGSGNTSLNESVSSQGELISPLKSLLYGGFSTSYQKLVSTIPYGVLVSSVAKNLLNKRQVSQKSIISVLLDGRIDWAILPKTALQAYSGPSLSVTLEPLPKKISSTLSKLLGLPRSTTTGLFKWTKSGFKFVSGRGQVALTGDGQIYRIILKENEEFLINKGNILAISVNGESDLADCVVSHSISNNLNGSEEKSKEKNVNNIETGFVSRLKNALIATLRLSSRVSRSTYDLLIGNNNYVKVIGPRNLLVQTNTNAQLTSALRSFKFEDNEIKTTELKLKNVEELAEPKKTGSAFLKIATVSDGKVEFKSTENFQDAVKKISKAAQNV